MMDFTDITTAVKKTTRKATDLALKPVKFVANPVLEANKKLQNSVFGPDLTLLETVLQREQNDLFHDVYMDHLDEAHKALVGKKVATKKLSAYITACKLIEAAPDEKIRREEKVDMMQTLFDDLRIACKEGIPTKLKDGVFSTDKKTTYTTDEFSALSDQLAATKKFIQKIAGRIEDDIAPVFLRKQPDASGMLLKAKDTQKQFNDIQKEYQEHVFSYHDTIGSGRSTINAIVECCDRLRTYHNNQSSLFGPEKTKYKSASDAELKKLKTLTTKDFVARQKKCEKQHSDIKKPQENHQKAPEQMNAVWTSFFSTWQTWDKKTSDQTKATAKNYARLNATAQKSLHNAQEALSNVHKQALVSCKSPFASYEDRTKHADAVMKQHDAVHEVYLLGADHIRRTGVQGELSMCSHEWLVDQRVDYLPEEMTLIRQHILHNKLMRRIWNMMADTVKSYESKIDDRKVYAKDIVAAPLKQLRGLTTILQDQVKLLDKTIQEQEEQLAHRKTELWDTITFKRLVNTKRTWQQDTTANLLGSTHQAALSIELKTQTTWIKGLQDLEKEISKKHNIDMTALDEQQKTVSLVKTKEQKDKLASLQKQVKAQEQILHDLATVKEATKTHIDETTHLQKKYVAFAQTHASHAQRYKKFASDVSKKLDKSPLKQWVDCSAQMHEMF